MGEATAPVPFTLAEDFKAVPAVALLLPLKFAIKFGHTPGDLGVGGQVRRPLLLGLVHYVNVRRNLDTPRLQLAGVRLPIPLPQTHRFVEASVRISKLPASLAPGLAAPVKVNLGLRSDLALEGGLGQFPRRLASGRAHPAPGPLEQVGGVTL